MMMMSSRSQFKREENALVVVAHPDDETIWMGGFILKHPELRWTIFSLCRASDPDRAPKFKRICRALGARAIITDLDDEGKINEREAEPRIEKLVSQNVGKKRFSAKGGPASGWDYIFTHGANGEYGHPRHKTVHQAVIKMVRSGKLKTGKTFAFNYRKISKYKLTGKADSDLMLKLNRAQFRKKISLMADIYGFDPDGIDAGFCTNPESFKIIK
jgi:LmbE family N-acetylglucosaminyl deacetylase